MNYLILNQLLNHLSQDNSPELTYLVTSFGLFPSTVQPTLKHVPKTCLTVPWKVLDWDLPSLSMSLEIFKT